MKSRVIELIAEQEPQRLLIANSSIPVDALEGGIYRWAGPLDAGGAVNSLKVCWKENRNSKGPWPIT